LAEFGINSDPAGLGGVQRHALACPALPTCGLALADAERVLPTLAGQLEEDLTALGLAGEQLSIRMTGCPNGCARPYMGDIGLVGRTKDVYNVYVGGDWANTRLNTLYAPSIRLEALADAIHPLLVLWRDEREADESFGDFTERWGVDRLRTQIEGRTGT
jgi:sulfite reductase (ferredoxin)